jgi:hypothetical protein
MNTYGASAVEAGEGSHFQLLCGGGEVEYLFECLLVSLERFSCSKNTQ